MTEQFTFSKEFTKVNNNVRVEWEAGRKAARNVSQYLNELVAIVHKEEPEWKMNKIAQQIWIANEDLEGFSKDTIYRNLDDDHKALLRPYEKQPTENNVIEESFLTREKNVTEDSSSRTLPTAYEVREAETTHEEEQEQELRDLPEPTTYNTDETFTEEPDTTYDKQFVDRLVKENAQLTEQFTFNYDLEVKDQVLPLKVTVYPEQKYGHVRLRKEKAK
jgi:hypothetical protein